MRALIFDAVYNSYRGVIVYIRVMEGAIRKGQRVAMMITGAKYEVVEVGSMHPQAMSRDELTAGEVGYLICNIKTLADTQIGDTVTDADKPATKPLPGYKEVKPVVFSGLYPAVANDYEELRDALDKLHLNDVSFEYHADSSDALGLGFRLGFLGLLHMEIVQERLEREFGLTLVTTMPNVAYVVHKTDGTTVAIEKASQMPDPAEIETIEEPYIEADILCVQHST